MPLSSSGSGASGVGGGGGGPSGAGGGVATSSGSGAAMDGTGTDGSAPHSSGGAIPPNASAPSSSSVPTGETIRVKFTSSARPLKRGNPHIDVWLQNSKHFTFRFKKKKLRMIECVVESVLHHHHVLFVRRLVCFPVFPGLIVYQHYNAQVFIFFLPKVRVT